MYQIGTNSTLYSVLSVTSPVRDVTYSAANAAGNAATPPRPGTGSGVWLKELRWWLLADLVRALAVCALRRFDLLSTVAPQDADEASHSVGLPLGSGHDLCQRRALGA